MSLLDKRTRDTIAGWLAAKEIEVFIGYEAGTVPLRATPAFIRRPEEVDHLIWDATCENNLAAFLAKYRGKKVGIMVKGCDARSIVGLMQEAQWPHGDSRSDSLRIVGASCTGVIDPRRVAERLGMALEDLDEARLVGDQVVVRGSRLPLAEALYDMCHTCSEHDPSLADVRVGTPVANDQGQDPYKAVRDMQALEADARWERFTDELQRCNLCYACRQACPLCYCNTCFVDRTMPRWVSQTVQPQDIQFYQIIRTFHLAGRCVGCGACTRACPQGVNLRLFLDKLRLDAAELYGYEAGRDPEAKPPLTTYSENDSNDQFM